MNSERVREIIKDCLWHESFDVDDEVPEGCKVVDVIFFKAGFHEGKAKLHAHELADLCLDGENDDMWQAGPSYIHVGAWMGDQRDALLLIALGHVAGLWECTTPRSTGFDDEEQIRSLAGAGFVYAIGLKVIEPPT